MTTDNGNTRKDYMEYTSREVRRGLNQISQFVLKTETVLNGRNGS